MEGAKFSTSTSPSSPPRIGAHYRSNKPSPWDTTPRFLRRDNDKIYGKVFTKAIENMGIEEVRISAYCPWQNPYAERVIGLVQVLRRRSPRSQDEAL